MSIVWEQVFNEIISITDSQNIDIREFLQDWAFGIADIIHVNGISIKKALDLEMTDEEISRIFCNSGYIICRQCQKMTEDDHQCKK